MSQVFLRQWAMLRLIPRAPRKIDAKSILERLDVQGFPTDIRTIQRDLQKLSGLFPLECDERSKPFGWYWGKSAAVEHLPGMDPQTALTFVLVQQFMEPLLPHSTLRYLTPHIRLASRVLKESSTVPLSQWPKKVRVVPNGQPLLPPEINQKVLDVVYDALLQGRRFEVDYLARNCEERQDFEVNPLGLVLRNSVTYLVCTLWEYEDIRLLVLHRMRAAKSMDCPSTVPGDFDLESYIQSGAFGFPGDPGPIRAIRFKALFDPGAAQHLFELSISENQRLTEQPDGRVLLEATVLNTGELHWWLQGFGELVEIVAPKKLRRIFADAALRQVENYQ
ncbi:MAG: WYL domain-containing protein [Pseudomonadota bacterium]